MIDLNKLKQKSWYYVLTTALVSALSSLGLYFILHSTNNLDRVSKVDITPVNFVAGLGVVASLIAALGMNFLNRHKLAKLKWFLNRPFMYQLLSFVVWAIASSTILYLLDKLLGGNIIRLVANTFQLVNSTFGIYIVALFFKMLFKD